MDAGDVGTGRKQAGTGKARAQGWESQAPAPPPVETTPEQRPVSIAASAPRALSLKLIAAIAGSLGWLVSQYQSSQSSSSSSSSSSQSSSSFAS